jgi:hypothetical protein
MKKTFFFSLVALACAGCHADGLPVTGVVQQIPVMADGANVSARPVYVLTDQKLAGPAIFSGLQGFGSTLTVVCCFEVKDAAPTSLDEALAKYGKDPEFAAHMKSIKGYRYIYAAQPSADKQHWTPLMKTLARNASNPNDASPFSAAAVAAQFDKPIIPASFTANGTAITLQTHADKKTGRTVYVFTHGGNKVEFSESAFAD